MPKEDFLLKQLEKLHLLLATMAGLKQQQRYEEVLQRADEVTNEWLGLSLNELLTVDNVHFEEKLVQVAYPISYLELIYQIFYETMLTYQLMDDEDSVSRMSSRTLFLLDLLTQKDKTFSFERETRRIKLEKLSKSNRE